MKKNLNLFALTELITLSRSGVAVHVRSVKEFLGWYKSNKVLNPQKFEAHLIVLPATMQSVKDDSAQ